MTEQREQGEELTRADRIKVMRAFLLDVGISRSADFLVGLQDAIEGLTANNQAYVEYFKKLHAEAAELREVLREVEKAARATGDYIGQDGQLITRVRLVLMSGAGREVDGGPDERGE